MSDRKKVMDASEFARDWCITALPIVKLINFSGVSQSSFAGIKSCRNIYQRMSAHSLFHNKFHSQWLRAGTTRGVLAGANYTRATTGVM